MTSSLVPQDSVTTTEQFNPPTGNNTVGNLFTESEDVEIASLSFRRAVSGHAGPSGLALYNVTDSTMLLDVSTASDDGSAGWHATSVTSTALVTGKTYMVFGRYPDNSYVTAWATAPPATEPPFTADGVRYGVGSGSTPTNVSPWELAGVSVTTTGATPDPPPPSVGGDPVLTGDLQAWLSSDNATNLHHGDLPWQTKLIAQAIAGVVGSTPGQLDATKVVSDAIKDLLTSTNHNLGTLWDLAGHLADLEIAAWQHFFGAGEQRLTGPDSAGGSAFYTADGNLVSQLVAETWQRVRVLRGDIGFGTDGWTMTAESDFEDTIAFAEPADAYTLHITSYQPTQAASSSPAGLWLPRIGWWCVLTGAHASQRQFVDFEEQLLSERGFRMPGCAIQLKPGTLATVQAWVLA
jgi:hypothetical protein